MGLRSGSPEKRVYRRTKSWFAPVITAAKKLVVGFNTW